MARTDPNNQSRYWWDPHIPGLSLMSADFKTQEFPLHTHEAFVIAVTEEGGSVITSRGVTEQADSSSLCVFNPAEPQASRMGGSDRWRYRSLYLTQAAINAVADGLGIDAVPYFSSNILRDSELIAGFLCLHAALDDGHDRFRERELLLDTFGCLFHRHGSGHSRIQSACKDRSILKISVDLMQERFGEELYLEELSRQADLTPFQLIGLFKRTTGLTPHAYLTQIRLYNACRYLRRGISIAEVAADCGFYDQSALTKHFKRCYGMTPLQFTNAATSGRAQ